MVRSRMIRLAVDLARLVADGLRRPEAVGGSCLAGRDDVADAGVDVAVPFLPARFG